MKSLVPRHIAVTMDGNGRWGKARGLTRSEGHFAGTKAMEKVIDGCIDVGVEILTLYAFSSENWKRSKDEVNYLMYLPIRFFNQKLPEFMRRNIKIVISGNLNDVPKNTKRAITKAIEETQYNTGLVVNFAFNYGGREEILQAVRQVINKIQTHEVEVDQIDEAYVQRFLYTKDLPDPELFIRTGGEQRMSNFLLWQSSMAELYFTDVYFPDFNEGLLKMAINEYIDRNFPVHYHEQII